jgi:S-adenosylmethionine decarboxylase
MIQHKKHSTDGKHILIEYMGCDYNILNNVVKIEKILSEAAVSAKMNIIGVLMHQFPVEGVSGVVLISESHLSIHTWPSEGYAAVDCYTCGTEGDPFEAHKWITEAIKATNFKLQLVTRGLTSFDF